MVTKKRVEGFAKRLQQACDSHPIVPPDGEGRQTYLARELCVSNEAVRKWMSGESMPRVPKLRDLARLLDVDEAWLALGVDPTFRDNHERMRYQADAEGAIYIVFGALMRTGASCAFSDNGHDKGIHFYLIRRGSQSAIHVGTGNLQSAGVYTFRFPTEALDNASLVGFIDRGDFSYDLIDMMGNTVRSLGTRKGGYYELTVTRKGGTYKTGRHVWGRVTSDLF